MRRRQRTGDVPAWSNFGIAIELESGTTLGEMLPGGRLPHEKSLSKDDTLRAAWAKYRDHWPAPELTYAYWRFDRGLGHDEAQERAGRAWADHQVAER